ncbi:Spy0128 family protein [Propionibacterium australiense]|uniref:Bacterial Ig-like domain n=1 Tax=Propionibacterium australiense TaxID=119981 RepID=A0A383S9D1_9ACTN|nr:bacterial Ig-like domain-containing protein [Propionibacterium australiense]RLP06592.1 hypothetical protein D9T14_11790 [Propionibacterium australiense]RLP10758.1 hypothetical protein D7U36_05585 [Propionibacterium australiense]SYZ34413.1 Bacterial Ig-like domain [Propionibacterium australiense]VEH89847.1 Bacterial Ig-like domain (group 3) [Propionibacterium australiense]
MNSTGRWLAAVTRSWTARVSIAAIVMLSCLLGLSVPAAMADSSEAIYTGANANTAALVDGALTHTTYFTATNRGGDTEESNHSTAGSPPALSIIDVDTYSDLNAVIELSNDTDEPIEDLKQVVALPSAQAAEAGVPQLRVDPSRVRAGEDGLAPESEAGGITIAYGSSVGAYLPHAEWSASVGGDWSTLQALELTGSLEPGETFRLTIALTLINKDELDLSGSVWVGIEENILSPATAGASTRIRFARRVTGNEQGTSPLSGNGQYRASSNAPEIIQSRMPTMQISDLTISNMVTDDSTDAHTASPDDRLFTGGNVSLDLTRVKSAIRDAGWQVEADENTSDGLAARYTYPSDLFHPTEATGSGALNGAEVRVRQVISAVNSTVQLGASWSPADNLDWIHDHAGADVALDSADVRVETNVDTSTPGIYQATYYYAPQAYYGSTGYEAAVTVEVAVATSATATVTGLTTLQGGELQDGQFTFELADASGALVATTTNLADGSFAFEPTQFDRNSIGTSTAYTIVQLVPTGAQNAGTATGGGITYDTHTEHVEVRVGADESGTNPVVTIVTDSDGVVFSNIQGEDAPSPSPSPSSSPSPGASPEPGSTTSDGSADPGQEEISSGTIPLISAESSALVMGAGAVMVTVGTAMGLHGKRR